MKWDISTKDFIVFKTQFNSYTVNLYIVTDAEIIEAWFSIEESGIIELMFGMPKNNVNSNDFIELAKTSIENHLTDYIKDITRNEV